MAKKNTSRKPLFLIFFVIILCSSILLNILFIIRNWQQSIVVRVVDGDTFSLADGRRVRLLGVDAPEQGRCMADEATNRLQELVLGKSVRLKDVQHDEYGRLLANVLVDAPFDQWINYLYARFIKRAPYKNLVMINRVMIEEGLGKYSFSGTQYKGVLTHAHQIARTSKLGIYSPLCILEKPLDPACVIKGNIRDGKRIYHLPRCSNYTDTVVETSFGDKWFCTEREAKAAGFLRATGCGN